MKLILGIFLLLAVLEKVTSNFNSTDCRSFVSCTKCVSAEFSCDWCVDAHRCTSDPTINCRNDILVTGLMHNGPSYRSGPMFCPSISETSNSNEILIPDGQQKSIKLKVQIMGQFIVQTRFVCQFNIEGRISSVNAQLLGDTIYCDAMKFTTTSLLPNQTVGLAVVWGGSKPLDNPNNTHINIYKCSKMALNCSSCLDLSDKFNCGWCSLTNTCEIEDHCNNGREGNNWLKRTSTCAASDSRFLDTVIDDFTPRMGPKSGGTIVTIIGQKLNASSELTAFFGDSPCKIISVNEMKVMCSTTAGTVNDPKKLKLIFDNVVRVENLVFEYLQDPIIISVRSASTHNGMRAKGIPAGGIEIDVEGNYFLSIVEPKMYVYYNEKKFYGECFITSNNAMTCYSPIIDVDNNIFVSDTDLDYGFEMDDVIGVQNLTSKSFSHFILYPNPSILPFDENLKYFSGDYLTINGENLNRVFNENDYIVMIGNKLCNILSLSTRQLICRPTNEITEENNSIKTVSVRVGNITNFNIGQLQFAPPTTIRPPFIYHFTL